MRKSDRLSISRYYNWLIHELILDELEPAIEKYAKGILLDIGCGSKPFHYLTKNSVSEHVGLEHEDTRNTDKADIWGSAYDIPIEDNFFDTVLCTDVLEHLEEPDKALNESCRVLKKGAYAIYTLPFFWHIHEEPRDFFRYSKYGLKYLFEKNGFEVEKIVPLTGFWGNVGQMCCYYFMNTKVFLSRPGVWIKKPFINTIQKICYYLDKRSRDEKYCAEYLVVAKKKL
ncbi:MAG: class I SAM-dependent methyltransferase [Cyclobacteriaceae bacterium]